MAIALLISAVLFIAALGLVLANLINTGAASAWLPNGCRARWRANTGSAR